jgi:hypothetical protein
VMPNTSRRPSRPQSRLWSCEPGRCDRAVTIPPPRSGSTSNAATEHTINIAPAPRASSSATPCGWSGPQRPQRGTTHRGTAGHASPCHSQWSNMDALGEVHPGTPPGMCTVHARRAV